MWQRRDLKTNAKQHLIRKYWQAFAVSLIVGFLSGNPRLLSIDYRLNADDLRSILENHQAFPFFHLFWFNRFFQGHRAYFSFFLLIIFIFMGMLSIAYKIFVSSVVEVGGDRWFSRNRESEAIPSIGLVFSLFKAPHYLKTVLSQLWKNLFLFLWRLPAAVPLLSGLIWGAVHRAELKKSDNWFYMVLLIMLSSALLSLPAIIKFYSYRLTPWILADHPEIGYKRALKLSIAMTQGHKWAMFILDLSFVGWYLLGLLACGLGVLFVRPYYLAVQSELYAQLRYLGVQNHLCTMEELGFFPVGKG